MAINNSIFNRLKNLDRVDSLANRSNVRSSGGNTMGSTDTRNVPKKLFGQVQPPRPDPTPPPGTGYQAPGTDLDPTGFGNFASFLYQSPDWAGGGIDWATQQPIPGWEPPWGSNITSFNEWMAQDYQDWLMTEGNVGQPGGGMGIFDDYYETMLAGDEFGEGFGGQMPNWAGYLNFTTGSTPGQGSNYMQPGATGGNIGGEGDLGYGSFFGGMGSTQWTSQLTPSSPSPGNLPGQPASSAISSRRRNTGGGSGGPRSMNTPTLGAIFTGRNNMKRKY